MQIREAGLIILAAVFVLGMAGFAVSKITKKNDTVVEEVIEDIIEKHTGLDIDLSPGDEIPPTYDGEDYDEEREK